MNAAGATNTPPANPKFSRYRSVRRAATVVIAEDVPPTPEVRLSQINRAPSRYRRANRPPVQTASLPAQPSLPSPSSPDCQHGSPAPKKAIAVNVDPSTANASPTSLEAAREEARMMLEGEYDRMQQPEAHPTKYDRKQDSNVPDLRRRTSQVRQPKSQPVYVDAPKLNVKMKIERSLPATFHDAPKSVGQRQQPPEKQPQPTQPIQPIQPTQPTQPTQPQDNLCPIPDRLRKFVDAPVSSAPRQAGPVQPQTSTSSGQKFEAPKFDAPISAVNAGERRVEVRLNQTERRITLPVTPTTNSKDLLNSASVVLSEDFNPKTSILVESFSKLGLERPLRRYEHIRDVMNSWDSDSQNYLSIMTESEFQATGLERDQAPDEAPCREMVQMHLSIRPGKWEKRWIILREDGQVTMSKRENDGDATNICHLSDYDVYAPTQKQHKRLRPPKKICFAVKSQQKSAMFLEGANFVHFFATNDKQTADRWYRAVQSWRSWYLVHMLGEGVSKTKKAGVDGRPRGDSEVRPLTAQSAETIPYQLGSFKPLLDFDELTFGTTSENVDANVKSKDVAYTSRVSMDRDRGAADFNIDRNKSVKRGSRQQSIPPPTYSFRTLPEVEGRGFLNLDTSDPAFTGKGLLARTTSTRRSQGAKASGQGVAGLRGQPLVDLTPISDFAAGSLLRKLEAQKAMQGENELKLDRLKRLEANVRVGEGYR